MAPISPRLRRVLDIARSQSALQRLRELANREDRWWAEWARRFGAPPVVTIDPYDERTYDYRDWP